jgi:hypothetical protein
LFFSYPSSFTSTHSLAGTHQSPPIHHRPSLTTPTSTAPPTPQVANVGSSYQLEYECNRPANERVFPHTPCSCTATKLRLVAVACGDACTLNRTKYASFEESVACPGSCPGYCPSATNATAQCTATPKNGCALKPYPLCGQNGFFLCDLNYSLLTVETRWAVACTFPVISDSKVAVLTAPMKVQCVGEYLEVGSVGHPVCTPGVDC